VEEAVESVTWLQVTTRRVIAAFLDTLARSHGWQTIYIISPWISEFSSHGMMSFTQLLKRFRDDDATVYVVTRPPNDSWHKNALDKIVATEKANVALVPSLHTKLYCASTKKGSFALLGSANLTSQSLSSIEIGVLLHYSGAGKNLVKTLAQEAAEIYRTPGRELMCTRKL
jgi:hypothetical protein